MINDFFWPFFLLDKMLTNPISISKFEYYDSLKNLHFIKEREVFFCNCLVHFSYFELLNYCYLVLFAYHLRTTVPHLLDQRSNLGLISCGKAGRCLLLVISVQYTVKNKVLFSFALPNTYNNIICVFHWNRLFGVSLQCIQC